VAQTGPGAALRTIAKREMEAHQFIMEYCGKLGLSRVAYWDARLNYKNYERDYQYSYLLDSSEG
jgi:hypothetical protein